MRPYFILGTPRSRTAWLAEFLSRPGRQCVHEPSRFFCEAADVFRYALQPAAAASDSLLTFRWRLLLEAAPDARIVVVRRPVEDVVESFARKGWAPPGLVASVRRLWSEVEGMCEVAQVLSVPFAALGRQDVCSTVYEYCHETPTPAGHWERLSGQNIQADIAEVARQMAGRSEQVGRVFPELRRAV